MPTTPRESERKNAQPRSYACSWAAGTGAVTDRKRVGKTEAGNINIYLTRRDIASYLGTTYKTIFRLINDLVSQGLIVVDGKSITVSDHDKLLAVTEESITAY